MDLRIRFSGSIAFLRSSTPPIAAAAPPTPPEAKDDPDDEVDAEEDPEVVSLAVAGKEVLRYLVLLNAAMALCVHTREQNKKKIKNMRISMT